jgi:hypothetical protein
MPLKDELEIHAAVRRPEQAAQLMAPGISALHFDYDDDSYAPRSPARHEHLDRFPELVIAQYRIVGNGVFAGLLPAIARGDSNQWETDSIF